MSFLNHKNNQEHTLPDVFTAVKHGVTARQVAEMYGIQVNAHGMACCPFHDDTQRYPSQHEAGRAILLLRMPRQRRRH